MRVWAQPAELESVVFLFLATIGPRLGSPVGRFRSIKTPVIGVRKELAVFQFDVYLLVRMSTAEISGNSQCGNMRNLNLQKQNRMTMIGPASNQLAGSTPCYAFECCVALKLKILPYSRRGVGKLSCSPVEEDPKVCVL